jgi:methylenetetrahydrofolate dehydrogenase (NADP+) / methenyltetrahydrofolate cyclohydrolase
MIIDGKAVAANLRAEIAADVAKLDRAPELAVVLVGEDPASAVYVRAKGKACREAGMLSFEHKLPADTSEEDLLALVRQLNADPAVDGILVQLPLPAHILDGRIIAEIDAHKDVDGFNPQNVGRLALNFQGFVPCTPMGCLMLIKSVMPDLSGKDAVVIGRSNIVGKPMAQLLLGESATVTIAHSRTVDLPAVVRRADIVVAAVGRPKMVKGDWLKPGAVVIDVGINRTDDGLVGDVDFASAEPIAGAITPVPGGVGPMTIACLLKNTLTSAQRRQGVYVKA